MNEADALARMVSPATTRRTAWHGGIIQIHVTRACDLACYGCTQGSNWGGAVSMMPVDLFEHACRSLRGYFGVVGVFGGNPCLHPDFTDLCEVLRHYVPRERRGLWSNNLNGNGAVCRDTFNPNCSNLNVHLSQRAYDEIRRDWPEAKPFGLSVDSRHSPPFVAMQDVIPDEAERWRLIAECDVNQNWSAMIGMFRGGLRGWFCEVAGAQSILHQNDSTYPDTGVEIVEGWWNRPMSEFADQVRHHCHACGIPLRTLGELAVGGSREQISKTHAQLGVRPKRPGRDVQIVYADWELDRDRRPVTEYMQKGQ